MIRARSWWIVPGFSVELTVKREIRAKDNGIGFKEKYTGCIFKPFQSLDHNINDMMANI